MNPLASVGRFVCAALLLSGLAVTAQPIITNADQVLGPVPAEEIPASGTFWFVQQHQPPLPWNPFPELPVYLFGTNGGHFLVDDSQVDYVALREAQAVDRALVQAEMQLGIVQMSSLPELPGGGGGAYDPGVTNLPMAYNYAAGSFYIELVGVTNGTGFVALHGTVADELYQVFSKETLTNGGWIPEGEPIIGQDSLTLTTFPIGDRTNNLFLRAMSWQDSDGSGMPDWSQLNNFGHLGVDPYADPDGDGWVNIQEYQNGTKPTGSGSANKPPPPKNFQVRVDGTGTNVILTWESGGGSVVKYEIYSKYKFSEIESFIYADEVGGSTFSWTDSPWTLSPPADDPRPRYYVSAIFADGSHSDSSIESSFQLADKILTHNGEQGDVYLLVSPKASNFSYVRMTVAPGDESLNSTFWATNFTRGIAKVPSAAVDSPHTLWFQGVCIDGSYTDTMKPLSYRAEERTYDLGNQGLRWGWDGLEEGSRGFHDCRRHLKENLCFLLRAATKNRAFGYCCFETQPGSWWPAEPESRYERAISSGDYEYSGFHTYSQNLGYSFMQSFRPLRDNFLWKQFGWSDYTGVDLYSDCPNAYLLRYIDYQISSYTGLGTEQPLPYALTNSQIDWIYSGFVSTQVPSPCDDLIADESGITLGPSTLTLAQNAKNLFGLPITSVRLDSTRVLHQGGTTNRGSFDGLFTAVELPQLETIGYYFASQTPRFRFGSVVAPLPGAPGFSNSISTPLMIASIGQPITISGWAKQAINNGYPDKFGYLEQYFDKAYVIGGNGVLTAETGILSPYGEFLPTEPGPAALVTMPDIDTEERGTGIVHVIKLQLDVNHDGAMDLTFAGPDNTTQSGPFKFWANNDYDRGHQVDCGLVNCDWEEDDLKVAGVPDYPTLITPDYAYATYAPFQQPTPRIPSMRDLEDYARLWLPGMSSLMAAMPTNHTVKLTLTGDAQIRIFRAVESAGRTDYLLDEVTASNQVAQSASLFVGLLTSASPITLSGQTNFSEHFIWCGAHRGTAEVHLQILDGNQNLLADTATYIEIKDIKEMYERWTVGDKGSIAPAATAYLAAEDLPTGGTQFQYGPADSTTTPYILFVHGWNMERWEKDRFAEAAYKRLYWQGYNGRFGIYRWPTYDKGPATLNPFPTTHFDGSEYNAWRSGAPLQKLLVDLNTKYPGQVRLMAHSMGNVVAGEALRTNVTLVHTYVAMQSAIAAHAYDASVTNRDMGLYGPSTPNRFAAYPTNGMPCYFDNAAGASRYINFFNKDDWALGWWEVDQNLKPNNEANYDYHTGSNGEEHYIRGSIFENHLHLPQDTFEIFPFIIEARSLALGAQANVDGVFRVGDAVDLRTTPFLFGDAHKGHSGQFRSTNMKRHIFWERTLQRMQLK